MKKRVIAAALMCLPAGVWAWQGTMAEIGVTQSELQSKFERATREKGDGLAITFIGAKQLLAAKLLSEPQQVALMKELGAAAKIILTAPAFQAAHDAFITKQFAAVNHGIKVTSMEQMAMQSGSSKAAAAEFESKSKRDGGVTYIKMVKDFDAATLKFINEKYLKEWTENSTNVKRNDRAKYAKLADGLRALQDLLTSDPEKFRRGLAVLMSAERGGPDTEEALFAAQAALQKETEQLAWDKYNLRGAMKRVLAQAVAEAPTVDFAAETVEKDGSKVFVNRVYEKKSLTWKAMYRAGKGTAMAGVAIATAWLKEL